MMNLVSVSNRGRLSVSENLVFSIIFVKPWYEGYQLTFSRHTSSYLAEEYPAGSVADESLISAAQSTVRHL